MKRVFALPATYGVLMTAVAITGSMQGNQVSLSVKLGEARITLTGTVVGDKMSGTTAQGAPWTATRQ